MDKKTSAKRFDAAEFFNKILGSRFLLTIFSIVISFVVGAAFMLIIGIKINRYHLSRDARARKNECLLCRHAKVLDTVYRHGGQDSDICGSHAHKTREGGCRLKTKAHAIHGHPPNQPLHRRHHRCNRTCKTPRHRASHLDAHPCSPRSYQHASRRLRQTRSGCDRAKQPRRDASY